MILLRITKAVIPELLFLLLFLPEIIFAHGKGHHPHPNAHALKPLSAADSIYAIHGKSLQRLMFSVRRDLEAYRHVFDYEHAAERWRLYRDDARVDRAALYEDLLRQEWTTQHYHHNVLAQAIHEAQRITQQPGYLGKKIGLAAMKYAMVGNWSGDHFEDAGLLLLKPNEKLLKNNLISVATRLTAPEIDNPPGTIAIDIHVHTMSSFDGTGNLETLIIKSAQRGLDAIAITDHDNFDESLVALELAERLKAEGKIPPEFVVVPGEEVSSRDGHILALFIRSYIPDGLSAAATIAEIHRQGGVAIAPHPMEPQFGLGAHLVSQLPLDGMVVTGTPAELFRSAELAKAQEQRLAIFMDTDSHVEDGVGWSGYTLIRTTDRSPKGIKTAIRARQTMPVHRLVHRWFLNALEQPVAHNAYSTLGKFFTIKERVESWIASILHADAVQWETVFDHPIRAIMDLYTIPEVITGEAIPQISAVPFTRNFTADYGPLRLRFKTSPNRRVDVMYKISLFKPT